MSPIFISYSFLVIYDLLIGGINVFDFHIILIFTEYYTQIVAVFDETDADKKQTVSLHSWLLKNMQWTFILWLTSSCEFFP